MKMKMKTIKTFEEYNFDDELVDDNKTNLER
jgi:hypothetical protein